MPTRLCWWRVGADQGRVGIVAGDWQDRRTVGRPHAVLLERVPNKAGICNMVCPGRIVLDKPMGQFDTMLHLFTAQAKMAAYEELGMFALHLPRPLGDVPSQRSDQAEDHSGRRRQAGHHRHRGERRGHGASTSPLVTGPHRHRSSGAGCTTGWRYPRRVRGRSRRPTSGPAVVAHQVMGTRWTCPSRSTSRSCASGKDAENLRAVQTMKAYYGKMVSMYVIPRDGKVKDIPGNPDTYMPNDVFVTDYSEVHLPVPRVGLQFHPHRDRPASRHGGDEPPDSKGVRPDNQRPRR